jgi:hypothetical protein
MEEAARLAEDCKPVSVPFLVRCEDVRAFSARPAAILVLLISIGTRLDARIELGLSAACGSAPEFFICFGGTKALLLDSGCCFALDVSKQGCSKDFPSCSSDAARRPPEAQSMQTLTLQVLQWNRTLCLATLHLHRSQVFTLTQPLKAFNVFGFMA